MNSIPKEILAAAELISDWATENNVTSSTTSTTESQMKDPLIQQALDESLRANEISLRQNGVGLIDLHLIAALRARLAEPEPEPVAWRWPYVWNKDVYEHHGHDVACKLGLPCGEPLYTAPSTTVSLLKKK